MKKPLSYYLDLLKRAWNDVPELSPYYPARPKRSINEPEKMVWLFPVHFINSIESRKGYGFVDIHEISLN